MTDQTESASENAALLRVLDMFPPKRRYADLADYCARTIRGLEDEIAKLKHGLQRVQADKEALIRSKRNVGNRQLRNLLAKRTHALYRVIDELRALRKDVAQLRAFANEIGDYRLDVVEVQEVMATHGLIAMTYREEPCGDDCYCRDEYGISEFPIDCYKATPLLTGQPLRASPTRDGT